MIITFNLLFKLNCLIWLNNNIDRWSIIILSLVDKINKEKSKPLLSLWREVLLPCFSIVPSPEPDTGVLPLDSGRRCRLSITLTGSTLFRISIRTAVSRPSASLKPSHFQAPYLNLSNSSLLSLNRSPLTVNDVAL